MLRRIVPALVALATASSSPTGLHAQTSGQDPVTCRLISPPSEFEWGCFGPCACPVLIRSPLAGSFVLQRTRVDPLYAYYDVRDVHWTVPGDMRQITITGSGTYRRGGEVAIQEQLALDLSFDGMPVQHFDSGLRSPAAALPEIDIRISLHGESCHDSVLVVDVRPQSVAGAGSGAVPMVSASPNPFAGATEIRFALSLGGPVDLGIFDSGGRLVRWLARGAWLPAGPHTFVWDGRLANGAPAPAGLYLVRLETPSGRVTRRVSKRP